MSRANCANALELVRQFGRLTRRQLESATGLSWGGVTNMVNRLTDAGYLVEHKENIGKSSGRTPGVLEINGEDHFTLGVDVNDTGLSACMMNLKGEILSEHSAPADFSSNEAVLNRLTEFIDGLLAQYEGRHIMAIGISMQGEVDGVNGVSVRLSQCPGWSNVPLKDILSERFGMEVVVGHDPDCMLLTHLEDSDDANMVLLRIDKSIGMAAALRGEILYGSGLWEIAHMVVDPQGPMCRCGRRGCLHTYVSACMHDGAADENALKSLAKPLATAADNLIGLFRPDTLILCGDLMKHQECFSEHFSAALAEIGGRAAETEVLTVADAKAAMKGAALLAVRHAVRQLEI